AQPGLDALNHLPLVLEGAGLTDQQPNQEGTDVHNRSVNRLAGRGAGGDPPGEAESRQSPLHLLDAVGLDDVVDLDVVVAGHLDPALEALAPLLDGLLDALQRVQTDGALRRRVDDDAAADHAHLGVALDRALGDVTAGDHAHLADLERLADDGAAQVDDLLAR